MKGCLWTVGIIVLVVIIANGGGIYIVIAGAIAALIFGGIKLYKYQEQERIADEKRQAELRKALEKQAAEAEKRRKEEEDEMRRQMQTYASDFRQKSNMTIRQCESNISTGDNTGLSPVYQSVDLQEKIWSVTNAISLTIQSLENTIEEINGSGDK